MRAYLRISTLLFLVFGILHSLRLIYHWPVILNDWQVPMGVSWVAATSSALLALVGVWYGWFSSIEQKEKRLDTLLDLLEKKE